MKTICLASMVTVSILIFINGIQAQNIQNQVKQPRQFSGNWKPELGQPLDGNKFQNINRRFQDIENIHRIRNLITTKANQLKSTLEVTQKLDSSITESWNESTSQWVVSGKEEYTYDANGNKTLDTYYNWNESTSQWVSYGSVEYTYDINGNITLSIKNVIGIWGVKSEYAYDAIGNKTLRIDYLWDESTSQYIPTHKSTYNCDINGIVISLTGYNWNESTSQWVNYENIEYEYNANRNDTLRIHYTWNKAKNQWDLTFMEQTTYDSNGNKTLVIGCTWGEFAYEWFNATKVEYSYDANGNNTSFISYTWENPNWVAVYKEVRTYDENGNETSYINYGDWSIHDGELVGNFKVESTYDANGNKTLSSNYSWDISHNQWVETDKTTYYYSEYNPSFIPKIPEKNISVYPNPAKEFIAFELKNISSSAIVELFDLQGKKVMEKKLSEDKKISVSNLPKGLYMFKLNNFGIIYKGKIIIE